MLLHSNGDTGTCSVFPHLGSGSVAEEAHQALDLTVTCAGQRRRLGQLCTLVGRAGGLQWCGRFHRQHQVLLVAEYCGRALLLRQAKPRAEPMVASHSVTLMEANPRSTPIAAL